MAVTVFERKKGSGVYYLRIYHQGKKIIKKVGSYAQADKTRILIKAQIEQNGDLFLEVKFNRHKHFTIDGKNINLILPITPWEAALGTKLSIPTLGGTVEMKLAENTKGGKKLRLKGRGLPGKDKGDQYVVLQIMTPEATTDELKDLYKKMSELSQFNPRNNF